MRRILLSALILVATLSGSAQPADETRLIQILQSAGPAAEQEDACRRLKQIGTAAPVPALARLLTDDHLYQSACDALETLPAPEAGSALQAALHTTQGNPRAGVIHSLGERRYRPAATDLARLLNDPDSLIAVSAARALGRIGGDEVVRPLEQSLATAADPIRSAIVDALLDCASQLLAAGNHTEANRIYQRFNDAKEKENVRIAAYAGMIRTGEDHALALVTSGLMGTDTARQAAALRLAGNIQDPKATAAFTNLLVSAPSPMQLALLRLLQQRGDAAAAPAVAALARHQDSTVRVAAIAALGTLGDASVVSLLANAATSSEELEQKAARQALTELRRGNVADRMIAQLSIASPGVQVELIRALTARMDKASAPRLLELARTGNASAKRMALRGLEQLAEGADLPALVTLLEEAKDESSRAAVQNVFEALADRTPTGRNLDVTSIVTGLATSDVPTRIALLQVSAFFVDDGLRNAFRAALKDPNAQVRTAAARALCNTCDAQLMPDLLRLAKGASELNLRALALEGYVRLVGEHEAAFPVDQRVQMLKSAYELTTRAEEKRLILSSLATAPTLEALHLAERAQSEPEIKTEADVAALRIAKSLLPSEPTAAMKSLQELAAQGIRTDTRNGAEAALKQYDSGWLCTGPFRQPGMECTALFDFEFAPEQKDSTQATWQRAPGTADLTRPGEVDLQSVVGGDHCVVYLKTRVFAPTAGAVLFEIGSDDGIKLWVNGELTHANNKIRGLTPGEDRANGQLRSGRNDLFVKLTQATAGCGMTLSIKNPDGSEIPGLRFDP